MSIYVKLVSQHNIKWINVFFRQWIVVARFKCRWQQSRCLIPLLRWKYPDLYRSRVGTEMKIRLMQRCIRRIFIESTWYCLKSGSIQHHAVLVMGSSGRYYFTVITVLYFGATILLHNIVSSRGKLDFIKTVYRIAWSIPFVILFCLCMKFHNPVRLIFLYFGWN